MMNDGAGTSWPCNYYNNGWGWRKVWGELPVATRNGL